MGQRCPSNSTPVVSLVQTLTPSHPPHTPLHPQYPDNGYNQGWLAQEDDEYSVIGSGIAAFKAIVKDVSANPAVGTLWCVDRVGLSRLARGSPLMDAATLDSFCASSLKTIGLDPHVCVCVCDGGKGRQGRTR